MPICKNGGCLSSFSPGGSSRDCPVTTPVPTNVLCSVRSLCAGLFARCRPGLPVQHRPTLRPECRMPHFKHFVDYAGEHSTRRKSRKQDYLENGGKYGCSGGDKKWRDESWLSARGLSNVRDSSSLHPLGLPGVYSRKTPPQPSRSALRRQGLVFISGGLKSQS